MKDVFVGNICWHPTFVAPKIAQNLHIIKENAPLMVFDLQMKICSHKTWLKEKIELFSTCPPGDAPEKRFYRNIWFLTYK